jgi:hypothetical protein
LQDKSSFGKKKKSTTNWHEKETRLDYNGCQFLNKKNEICSSIKSKTIKRKRPYLKDKLRIWKQIIKNCMGFIGT